MIGIPAIEYVIPDLAMTLEELEVAGLVESGAARLRSVGFGCARVSAGPADALASAAVGRLIQEAGIDPESIDALFHAAALPSSHAVDTDPGDILSAFSYPAFKIQYEHGLMNAVVRGVSQAGCLGLMGAIGLAQALLETTPGATRAICVSGDVLPKGAPREIIYNVVSDGACAVLVEKDATRNVVLASRSVSKGYYWDASARRHEIVAAYFPTAKTVIGEALARAGVATDDIACVIPHNVSRRSWEILLPLVGLPEDRFFGDNIAAIGHVIAADNLINLADAARLGRLRSGDKALLFNFGFGAAWSCMVVEH